jgi:hypothetical protein
MDVDLEGLISDVFRQQMPAALYQWITRKSTPGTVVPPASVQPRAGGLSIMSFLRVLVSRIVKKNH